jgi:hypothetical protein
MLYSRTDPIGVAERIEIVMDTWRSNQVRTVWEKEIAAERIIIFV